MVRLSFALAAVASFTLVAGQTQSAVTALAADADDVDCGGCYLKADVAGVVFGGVQTVTDIKSVSIAQSPNGTNITTITSLYPGSATVTINQGEFSYNPEETGTTAAPAINFADYNDESTVLFSGAVLTSPTQYEVFTAFSVTSYTKVDGSCSPVPGPPQLLSEASKYVVSASADNAYLLGVQSSFIAAIGLSCSASGGKVNTIVQSMVSRQTQDVTTAGIIRPTPVAASAAASSTVSSAAPTAPLTTAPSTTAVGTSSTTVIYGNSTLGLPTGTGGYTYAPIAPGAASVLEVRWVFAAVAAIGLGAVLL